MTHKPYPYCTTPEQAEVLLKAGLPADTCDMYWFLRKNDKSRLCPVNFAPFFLTMPWSEFRKTDYRSDWEVAPCWTFGRLQSLILEYKERANSDPKSIGETLVWSLCSLIVSKREKDDIGNIDIPSEELGEIRLKKEVMTEKEEEQA